MTREDADRTAAIRIGIIETAKSLGIDPVDLATAISYETAGTFDPTKAGPTTQWGQHRGLIQFGEPQAKQFGVDWNDPIGSQLGPGGAVSKYLMGAGVKPGMGMLDIYSAINAGSVGRYNASDANNGGAPGTVRDKVEGQMSGHRQKAIALLGGEFSVGESKPAKQSKPLPDYAIGALGGGYNNPTAQGSTKDAPLSKWDRFIAAGQKAFPAQQEQQQAQVQAPPIPRGAAYRPEEDSISRAWRMLQEMRAGRRV